MSDDGAPNPTPSQKRRATRKAGASGFKPISDPTAKKEMLSPEGQKQFYELFSSLTGPQKAAVITVLNAISSAPLMTEGYRKFFRFWRRFGPSVGQVKL